GCSAAASTASSFLVARAVPLELLAAPGGYPAAGGPVSQVFDPHQIGITSVAAAAFGAGTGGAVGRGYDWAGGQGLRVPMDQFGPPAAVCAPPARNPRLLPAMTTRPQAHDPHPAVTGARRNSR